MPFHFHFTQYIDAAQIQLFAKIVKCMLDDEFSMKNAQWVDCAMPQEVQDRIVSISKPYVRPIVRGKEVKSVEFGAKVNNI